MTIDRLGGIDPLKNVNNTQKPHRVSGTAPSDSISLSSEAKELSEVYSAMEAANSATLSERTSGAEFAASMAE